MGSCEMGPLLSYHCQKNVNKKCLAPMEADKNVVALTVLIEFSSIMLKRSASFV